MVKIDVIGARLGALREYLSLLDAKRSLSFEQLVSDTDAYYAVQRWLQLACQVVIDIASHILAADFSTRADEYRDVILALGQLGVVPRDFAEHLALMAGFRNILVHEYLIIDPVKVYAALQTGPDDFRTFSKYIVEYLRNTGAL